MGTTRLTGVLAIWLLGLTADMTSGGTWSRRLGYPADQTVLILDVREAGISWEMNQASRQLLSDGKASTASVVATGPWFDEFASWAKQHPQHDVGLSLALTNPYPAIRWRLLSSEAAAPSLVDAYGFPRTNMVQVALCAEAEEVRLELDSQIARARDAGLRISHLTAYYGTVFCRTDLTGVYLEAAKRHWLPAPIVDLTPEMIEHFRSKGFPVDDDLVELIENYPLPKLDDIQFSPAAPNYEEKRDAFCELLESLPPGLVQIALHPADDSDGLRLLDVNWQQRVWDAQLLSDPKVVELLQGEKFSVTNWTEIMRRFESVPGAEPADADAADAE
jgi:hypothetical protein